MSQVIGNGSMKLHLKKGKYFRVWGGPYVGRPGSMFGVRMAREIDRPADVVIPTRDFQAPSVQDTDEGLVKIVDQLIAGAPVYVGCMAGRGRTGLMMAVLAKAFGEPNPIKYVRENYYPHAVETQSQVDFIARYQIPSEVYWKLAKARSIWNFRYWFKDDLTTEPKGE